MSGTPLKCQKRWGFRGLRPLTPTKGLCPLDPRRGTAPGPPHKLKWNDAPGITWHLLSSLEESVCVQMVNIIVGFFISVSSLKVFGHSIRSERRRIYPGKSIQALQNNTITILWLFSFRIIQPRCSGILLKLLCLFSSFLFHYKTFTRYLFIKYLIIVKPITSSHKIQAKTFTWPTCHFMLERLHWCPKGIEQACSWASCDIHISPFSIIYTKHLPMSYWYLCWIVWCMNQITVNTVYSMMSSETISHDQNTSPPNERIPAPICKYWQK